MQESILEFGRIQSKIEGVPLATGMKKCLLRWFKLGYEFITQLSLYKSLNV